MQCHKCGRNVESSDQKIPEEGLTCPYCGTPLLNPAEYDQDSAEVPDRGDIDEIETEEDD